MSETTHDPQQDYIASLEAENEREKKRVEVYRIAGEQAMAQYTDLLAQLTASVPLAEHNRIVAETVKSLDAERTNFEERIAALAAEADAHARLAVDISQQLDAVLGIFSDQGEPLPTLEQCRERWDGLKQQLAAMEETANQRESFYANVLTEADLLRVAERQKLTAIEDFIGLKFDEQAQCYVSGQPPYLSAGRTKTEACIAAVDALRMVASVLEEKLTAMTAERDRLKKLLDRDHTGLAAGMNKLKQIARGYSWLASGEWGSYDYTERTEATLRSELAHCFTELNDTADLALKESGVRATAAFHPERDQLTASEARVRELTEVSGGRLLALIDRTDRVRRLEEALKEIIKINGAREPGPIHGYHTWSLNMDEVVAAAQQALIPQAPEKEK